MNIKNISFLYNTSGFRKRYIVLWVSNGAVYAAVGLLCFSQKFKWYEVKIQITVSNTVQIKQINVLESDNF